MTTVGIKEDHGEHTQHIPTSRAHPTGGGRGHGRRTHRHITLAPEFPALVGAMIVNHNDNHAPRRPARTRRHE
jgi:hypothetical protein